MSEKKSFGLDKINLYLIAASFIVIIIGFILMTGTPTEVEFNPDVYSPRRITVGPMISFAGFILMIVAILFKPKSKED